MTASATPAPRTPTAVVPAVASLAWVVVAVLLLTGVRAPAALVTPLLIAIAGTAVSIVGFVRGRSSGKPNGALVVGLLSPAIALAAMTPLFAVAAPVVFAVFAVIAAAETAVLAIAAARSRDRV